MTAAADPTRLSEDFLASVDDRLADTDAFLARAYPGEDGRRQPVHTVYVPADRYDRGLPQRWGAEATALVAEHGGFDWLCAELGLSDDLAAEVAPKVAAKLGSEPIEDLRLDFEDGYGNRGDETEDRDAVRVARELAAAVADGVAPAFVGLRFKCFEAPTRRRGLRTLDLFLSTLLEAGPLPDGLTITFPKVSTVARSRPWWPSARRTRAPRSARRPARLRDPGRDPAARSGRRWAGRDRRRPARGGRPGDVAALRHLRLQRLARVSPRSTSRWPIRPPTTPRRSCRPRSRAPECTCPTGPPTSSRSAPPTRCSRPGGCTTQLVRRSLERAYYQGWDLHPAQLPTRFVANFAFYREGFARAADRLTAYVTKSGSGVLDEPATARALARYLHRGFACGAWTAPRCRQATSLTPDQLEQLARPKSDTENLGRPTRRSTP